MKNMINEVQVIREKIIPILKEHKILKAGLFGSYARGEQKKKSDIDILVEVNDNWSLMDIIRLKLKLQESLNKKVDLVEYEVIRKELRKSILNDEIPLIR